MQPQPSEPSQTQSRLLTTMMRILLSVYAFQAVLILGSVFYVVYNVSERWLTIMLVLLGLQVALGIGMVLLGRRALESMLRQPLNELTASARRLADGVQQKPVAAQPIQELDQLAASINHLGKELEATRAELARKALALDDAQQMLEAQAVERSSELRGLQNPAAAPAPSGQNRMLPGSERDELTGLANRARFMLELSRSLDEAAPLGEIVMRGLTALLFIDLDQFKVVNDSLGHLLGDDLLVAVAKRLRERLDKEFLLARFGGDEFVILVPEARSIREVEALAGRVLEWSNEPYRLGEQDVYITASIGIAVSVPGEKDAVSLLRDADTAVYRAKANGRNRYEVFSERMHLRARRLLMLEGQIRQAIDNEEFRMYYQPILTTHERQIAGLEALIRWKHPHQGFLLPQDFIPLAEETGLIKTIDYWVIEAVCAQAKRWSGNGYHKAPVAVNISGQSIMDHETPAYLGGMLAKYGLLAPAVDLEISEEAAMQHFEVSLRTLTTLRQMGISCWMDDFGQAYSSLSHLRSLPVNTIKIPALFIRKAQENRAIIKAIIEMSHALEMRVCAEGVETEVQAVLLDELGCDLVQGYYFSPPLPVAEIEQLLNVH